jgi:hypothetical protein
MPAPQADDRLARCVAAQNPPPPDKGQGQRGPVGHRIFRQPGNTAANRAPDARLLPGFLAATLPP